MKPSSTVLWDIFLQQCSNMFMVIQYHLQSTNPGENSEYVKHVSNDNHEFVIRRELAESLEIFNKMLRTPGGNESNTVYLHMINSRMLSEMCNYLSYHKQYLKKEGAFEIDPRDGYELLLVAGFFEI
ncbi:hypothetical protein CAEBREN_04663 [Caenorhabditis brenneri]|uniref:Elongin-C n=1 Tax=Caenorhabditis brenneri TaxID=135651 RepID=G0P7D1_CAEBE|nr:hypothetical protein CAEBREN_04663 [Caenorhabditis brenneri]